jgi:hypothetical protein
MNRKRLIFGGPPVQRAYRRSHNKAVIFAEFPPKGRGRRLRYFLEASRQPILAKLVIDAITGIRHRGLAEWRMMMIEDDLIERYPTDDASRQCNEPKPVFIK